MLTYILIQKKNYVIKQVTGIFRQSDFNMGKLTCLRQYMISYMLDETSLSNSFMSKCYLIMLTCKSVYISRNILHVLLFKE